MSDRKIGVSLATSPTLIDHYTAVVLSSTDYYAFGAPMPGRTFSSGSYRYGFNGAEKDAETRENHTEHRQYNTDLGRWTSLDPMMMEFAEQSPYNFSFCNPIAFNNQSGLAPGDPNGKYYSTNTGDVVFVHNDQKIPDLKDITFTELNKNILELKKEGYDPTKFISIDEFTSRYNERESAKNKVAEASSSNKSFNTGDKNYTVKIREKQLQTIAKNLAKKATDASASNAGQIAGAAATIGGQAAMLAEVFNDDKILKLNRSRDAIIGKGKAPNAQMVADLKRYAKYGKYLKLAGTVLGVAGALQDAVAFIDKPSPSTFIKLGWSAGSMFVKSTPIGFFATSIITIGIEVGTNEDLRSTLFK